MSPPELSPEPVEFQVRGRSGGKRIDAYLASRYPGFSRSVVQKLIDHGAVLINGQPVKASTKVRDGDLVRVWLPDIGDGSVTPEDIPIRIVREDDGFVVVDKDPGIVVHPARGNWSGTLVNALQFHFDRLSSVSGEERPGIIHRLDRDTSGLIVIGKDDLDHGRIARQFEDRTVSKEYRALVYGVPSRDQDYIDRPIGHHPTVREKMAIRRLEDNAREAVTFYEVLERFDGFAHVRCKPATGRTHQIRVHLTHIGHPIVADKMYSGRGSLTIGDLAGGEHPEAATVLIDRQSLHAHRLSFAHPRTGEPVDLEAPLPADMARTLEALRTFKTPGRRGG